MEIERSIDPDFRKPFATQDTLLPLRQLRRIDEMIEFAWENQSVWTCRCPIVPDDPPVYSDFVGLWVEGVPGYHIACDS